LPDRGTVEIQLAASLQQVTDFGIAKAISVSRTGAFDGSGITQRRTAIGTPAYMAPEQIADDPTLDRRGDLYSVGCKLYELLAGRVSRTAPQRLACCTTDHWLASITEERRSNGPGTVRAFFVGRHDRRLESPPQE